MFLLYIKKYWSYLLNICLVLLIILMYRHFSESKTEIKNQYLQQSEQSQLKFSQELISLLSKSEADNSRFIQEVQRINRETEEAIKSEMETYNQRIESLNNEELKAIEELKVAKVARAAAIAKSTAANPSARINDIYKKFGIEIYKKDP